MKQMKGEISVGKTRMTKGEQIRVDGLVVLWLTSTIHMCTLMSEGTGAARVYKKTQKRTYSTARDMPRCRVRFSPGMLDVRV